jgi:hypothetical protein
LVFILDEGSVFDAPLEKIWRFMQQSRPEQHRHGNRTNFKIEREGNSATISFETEGPGGTKIQIKNKNTMFPPVGRSQEYLEGPLAGSKAMTYYLPMGQRTGITVVGEYVSKTLPENKIRDFVLAQAERTFNEDCENLKNFV